MQPFFHIGHCAAAFDVTSNNMRVLRPHRMWIGFDTYLHMWDCGRVAAGRWIGAHTTKGIYWMFCVYETRSITITTIRCLIQVDGARHVCIEIMIINRYRLWQIDRAFFVWFRFYVVYTTSKRVWCCGRRFTQIKKKKKLLPKMHSCFAFVTFSLFALALWLRPRRPQTKRINVFAWYRIENMESQIINSVIQKDAAQSNNVSW